MHQRHGDYLKIGTNPAEGLRRVYHPPAGAGMSLHASAMLPVRRLTRPCGLTGQVAVRRPRRPVLPVRVPIQGGTGSQRALNADGEDHNDHGDDNYEHQQIQPCPRLKLLMLLLTLALLRPG